MKDDPFQYTENAIRTYSGKNFDLKILDPDSIVIEDIAHGLSHTARFAGHLYQMYNVAQHSVLVASKVSNEHRLAALLHDASEAYMGDMPSPFKKLMPDFKYLENELMNVIAQKFGFDYPFHKEVKEADLYLLHAEWKSFVMGGGQMVVWPPIFAKKQFLNIYKEITEQR